MFVTECRRLIRIHWLSFWQHRAPPVNRSKCAKVIRKLFMNSLHSGKCNVRLPMLFLFSIVLCVTCNYVQVKGKRGVNYSINSCRTQFHFLLFISRDTQWSYWTQAALLSLIEFTHAEMSVLKSLIPKKLCF